MKTWFFILALMTFACAASGAVTTVSPHGTGDYTSIQSAHNASSAGDTILVSPGDYNEAVSVYHQVTFLGAGFDQTRTRNFYLQNGSTGSVLVGFHLENDAYAVQLHANADSIEIRRCRLISTYGSYDPIYRECCGGGVHLLVEDCIVINTLSGGDGMIVYDDTVTVRNTIFAHVNGGYSSGQAIVGNPHYLEVTNCIFLSYYDLLSISGTDPIVFMNNIVYDWSSSGSWGSYPAGSVFSYNAASDYMPPGTNAILLTTNPFVDYDESGIYDQDSSDVHLDPDSGAVCIDAGNPGILDLDETVSDLGVYGGPRPLIDTGAPAYPFAIELITTPDVISSGDSLNFQSVGRIGPRY